MVEFALLIPVFILIVVVIFDFGRAIYYYSALHNAAREGARFGVIHPQDEYYADIQQKVHDYAIGLNIPLENITVDVGPSNSVGGEATYEVGVEVEYCFDPVTPLVELFLPNADHPPCDAKELLLTSDATMRTETKP
jgi:Flp pilus assembly protein TadG